MINEACPKHNEIVMRKAKHNGTYCPVCVRRNIDHVNKPMKFSSKFRKKKHCKWAEDGSFKGKTRPSKKAKSKCKM